MNALPEVPICIVTGAPGTGCADRVQEDDHLTLKTTALAQPAQTQPTWLRGLWLLVLGVALTLAQAMAAQARGAPDSFADLVEQVSGAVVNITT